MSKKYLPLYLAEFQFRHNNRKNPDIFGERDSGGLKLKRPTGARFSGPEATPAKDDSIGVAISIV